MILLTVGTQLGFDRLVRAMDEIAPTLAEPVLAQIGASTYRPVNMEWHRSLHPSEFERIFGEARLIVAHAGIGAVLTAQRRSKPIVLLPRRAALGEHRNEHQLATCAQLRGHPGIYIAQYEAELATLLTTPALAPASSDMISGKRLQLVERIAQYIAGL